LFGEMGLLIWLMVFMSKVGGVLLLFWIDMLYSLLGFLSMIYCLLVELSV